ncbi:MAG: hypothetical protein MZW92_20405, partial [Comamonadaceae bacterium]|nr:hypothetical protein [Comamonadaceae bacterium]
MSLTVRLARGANARAVQAHEEVAARGQRPLHALHPGAGLGRRGAQGLRVAGRLGRGPDGTRAAPPHRRHRCRRGCCAAPRRARRCRAAYLYELKNTRVSVARRNVTRGGSTAVALRLQRRVARLTAFLAADAAQCLAAGEVLEFNRKQVNQQYVTERST